MINTPENMAKHISFFSLGFRPFYLGGAMFGALSILIWILSFQHLANAITSPAITGILWHTHEMIFGFAPAIIVGFLFTAARNWTGISTPQGLTLALIWILWILGRVSVWYAPEPLSTLIDCAFLPIAAIVLFRVLILAGNRRNYFLSAALMALGILNLLFHWLTWQNQFSQALHLTYASIGLIIMFVSTIAGRVIPIFTSNAVPGYQYKQWKLIESLAAPSVIATFLLDAINLEPLLITLCAISALIIHSIRIIGWQSWRVGYRPILNILHIAYAWIPIGFLILALSSSGLAPHSIAIHAFTVGAMGCAIIAMITRTALGHTGRAIRADKAELASYSLMIASALLRVFGPWFNLKHTALWITAAGICWIASLTIYIVKYSAILALPRADEKHV